MRRSSILRQVIGVILIAGFPTLASAQEHGGADETRAPSGQQMVPVRMVMPTNNAKVFRLIRPTVAALQLSLAERQTFGGRVTGLYSPSTREAMAAFQSQRGAEVTGLPTLSDVLVLLKLDPAAIMAKYGERIVMTAHTAMAQSRARPMPGSPATVEGDLAAPKSLMLMEMRGMRLPRNDHTRAVRAVRDLVAALQIKLAEGGYYGGPIDGLPATPAMLQAVEAYQRAAGLELSGELDSPTALTVFGLDPTAVVERYGDRFDLEYSPVALHEKLMRRSNSRFPLRRDRPEGAGEPGR
jgi:peptidoglycan hydrolase-like protein with peptidoglycan-binding domain